MNVRTKFEVRIHEIIGSTPRNGQSLDTPTLRILPNFHELLFGWNLRMYLPNLKSVALPVPEIIAISVLGWGCEPPILGKERQ